MAAGTAATLSLQLFQTRFLHSVGGPILAPFTPGLHRAKDELRITGGRMAIQPNEGFGTTGATYSDSGSSEVRERARELVNDAKETGQKLVSQAGERARTGIDETKLRAARELDSVANALRGCGGDLGSQEDSMLAPYVERVADQVGRVANMLETRTVNEIARDVEGFARRNPAVFLGGCFAVGMLAARFLKSSKPQLPVLYDDANARYAMGDQRASIERTASSTRYDEPPISGGGAMYGGQMRGTTASSDATVSDRPDYRGDSRAL